MGIMRRALDLLFPRGPLWHFTGDAVLLFDSIALSLDSVKEKIDQARAESIPATALDTLPEWHSTLGIAYDPTLPLERQRNMLTAILTADGTATRDGLAYQIAKEYPALEVNEPVTSGLVGIWPVPADYIPSDTGVTILDDSGVGNDMIAYGATPSGEGGLIFDGANDYGDIGDKCDITSALSWSVWFKTVYSAGNQSIMSKDSSASRGPWIRMSATGGVVFLISGDGTASTSIQTAIGGYNNGSWHLATGVFTPSQKLEIYIDGVLSNYTITSIPAQQADVSVSLMIGRRPYTTAEYFSGTIRSPRIYNRALSAKEVYSIYKSPEIYKKNHFSVSGTVDRIQDARRVGAIAAHFAPLHLVPTVLGFTAPTAGNPNPVPPVPSSGTSIISVSAVARAAVASLGLARCGKAS